jgi:simple sugar transport system permease protein
MTIPLAFAALGGVSSERCGVINIALEGKMLVGAFAAATVAFYTNSAYWGLLAGGCAGLGWAALYSLFVIYLRANQIVSGVAMTLLAMGVIPFACQFFFGNTGSTPELAGDVRLSPWFLLALLACATFLVFWVFRKTPFGLWHKFAGEHPLALEVAGVSVPKVRWSGVLLAGFCAGLGGAALSICLSGAYTRNMVAGRGYIALAAVILGGWRPVWAVMACLMFGAFDALGILLQSMSWGQYGWLPQIIQVLPYLLTLVVVGVFAHSRRGAPKALGVS